MKNRLLFKVMFHVKRLSFMVLFLAISSGLAFSQGKLTVTTNADDGAGSLRQAITDAIDGDTIVFSGVDSIALGNPLLLGGKTLTIDGATAGADVILDGRLFGTEADDNRVIEVAGVAGKVVTLKDLTIQYGYAKDTVGNYLLSANGGGGGLLAESPLGGELVLTGCTFMNNKSTARGGGAKIYGLSTITDCRFIGNSALDVDNGDGGGLYAHFTSVTACSFEMNTAGDQGGGAVLDTLSTVSESHFMSNSSVDDGGGLRTQDITTFVSNCSFELNVSDDKGGGIYLNGGTATDCRIIGNQTTGSSAHGGGAYLNFDATLLNSYIADNLTLHADADGAGVNLDQGTSYMENCIITGNTAGDHAGGVFFKAGKMVNCIVDNNSCGDDGAGIYMDDARTPDYPLLINCVITNNKGVDSGGGLSIEGGGQVYNCTFAGNSGKNGGGIRGKSGTGAWQITNSIIFGNDATDTRKNIRLEGNTADPSFNYCAIDTAVNITDLTAVNATNITWLGSTTNPFIGGEGQDAYYLAAGNVLIDGGTTLAAEFTAPLDPHGNTRIVGAAIDLGAFEAMAHNKLIVTTEADAGAGSLKQVIADAVNGDTIVFDASVATILVDLPIELGDKTLVIDGTTPTGNVVLDGAFYGTAVDTNRVVTVMGKMWKNVELSNLTIQNGYAKDTSIFYDDIPPQGGGLFVHTVEGGKLMAESVVFQNNMASAKGGGVSSWGPNTFTNCSFINNKAMDRTNGDGGGATSYEGTVFESCTFTGNFAGDNGGGLALDSSMANNCHFEANIGTDDGGGVYSLESATLTNSTITLNQANRGGGLYQMGGMSSDLDINNNKTVNEGSYTSNGGGVHLNDDGVLKNSSITNNSATADTEKDADGGGIYMDEPECVVDNCIITGNDAIDHAGGVYIDEGILKNSTISNNTCVDDGGGVFLDETIAFVENCTVNNNQATDHGGGIFINAGTVKNCVIDSNISGDDGGGVNIDDLRKPTPGQLIGCVVSNNTAADQGGGVYVLVGEIVNCNIINNSAANGDGVRGSTGPWHITNSILYGNTANDVSKASNSATEFIINSALTAGHGFTTEMVNCIDLSASPFVGGTGSDSLYIPEGSPLIDAGIAIEGLPEFDLAGNVRVYGSSVDIGAFESLFAVKTGHILNVDMSTAGLVVGDRVFISGAPWGWPEPGTKADLELFDTDGDGIYTVQVPICPNMWTFKFFKNPGWNGEPITKDRVHIFAVADETLSFTWGVDFDDVVKNNPLPATFETPNDMAWGTFELGPNPFQCSDFTIVPNPDATGINTSANALQFVVNDNAQPWAGAYSGAYETIEFTEEMHTLSMMVYKTVISPSALKVEDSSNGGPVTEVKVSNTKINEWELLTFDFSACIGFSYPKLVFFPDFPDTRTAGTTVLLDNIGEKVMSGTVINVDMASAGLVSGDRVFISGSAWNWPQPGTNADLEMFDTDGDGIFTVTLPICPNMWTFKFFKNANWDNGEPVTADRVHIFAANETLSFTWGVNFDDVVKNNPLPATFESSNDMAWGTFELGPNPFQCSDFTIVANPSTTGINTSANALQFVVNDNAQPWAGAYSGAYEPITFTQDMHILSMMVYKTIISPSALKVEDSSTGGAVTEIKVSNTVMNEWELLKFDFSAVIGHTYPKLVFFPDFPDTRTAGTTVLLDNIGEAVSSVQVPSYNANGIMVYPNPVTNELNVTFSTPNAKVTIYNSLGRIIEEVMAEGTKVTFNVSHYDNGLYFVKINNSSVVKFVK
ncbi:MAG: T9SS type A sorting domain-containing protein [Bacteroidales bacterium]|nr:T9SS type A sorting domain-containing protein [Bacteroidales bacterium]